MTTATERKRGVFMGRLTTEPLPEQAHDWQRNPFALELVCRRCEFTVDGHLLAHLSSIGWDTDSDADLYWALCGNDLFSNGCCPRRVN